MLMQDDKKKMISLIVKRASDKKDGSAPAESVDEAPSKDGAELDSSIGMESAAEELMNAKDPKEYLAAFKSLMQMLEDEKSASTPEQA